MLRGGILALLVSTVFLPIHAAVMRFAVRLLNRLTCAVRREEIRIAEALPTAREARHLAAALPLAAPRSDNPFVAPQTAGAVVRRFRMVGGLPAPVYLKAGGVVVFNDLAVLALAEAVYDAASQSSPSKRHGDSDLDGRCGPILPCHGQTAVTLVAAAVTWCWAVVVQIIETAAFMLAMLAVCGILVGVAILTEPTG